MTRSALILLLLCLTAQPAAAAVISGVVTDRETSSPIPFATVKLLDGSQSTLTNDRGAFQLRVEPGIVVLKISHISYFSQTDTIQVYSIIAHEVALRPSMIDLSGATVYASANDPAERIIREAIKRKEAILNRLHDYQFDAYARLTVTARSGKDSGRIVLITETQSTTLWERPNKYKEVLHARRQTANMKADDNLVTVGELLNFNENRLDIGQYRVVSPTATDALEYYRYLLLDTVVIDNHQVFLIELLPINEREPVFTGTIMIADSTYAVVAVDVGLSKGIVTSILKEIRYSQRTTDFIGDIAMPSEIHFSATLKLPIALPDIPKVNAVDYVASLSNYQFDRGHARGTFDEYELTVAPDVDMFDSIRWAERQLIPLTPAEVRSYERIDSIEHAPKPAGNVLLQSGLALTALALGGKPDLFRFNRVEGPYFGLNLPVSKDQRGFDFSLTGGRAIDLHEWGWRIDGGYTLSRKDRFGLLLSWYDEVALASMVGGSGRGAATALALVDQSDPRDYYRARGVDLSLSRKLVNKTTATLSYHDARESSLPVTSDFAIFNRLRDTLVNRPATEGRFRSIGFELRFDTRKYVPQRKRDQFSLTNRFFQAGVQLELSDNDLFSTARDYTRVFGWLYWSGRFLPLGTTQVLLFGGQSDGDLPLQKLFTIQYGGGWSFNQYGLQTIERSNLIGDEAVGGYLSHNFARRLWIASDIPLVRDIPFGLILFGGVAATDLVPSSSRPTTAYELTAPNAYAEAGFRLTNLTPFLGFFNLAFSATWQVSEFGEGRHVVSGLDVSLFGD